MVRDEGEAAMRMKVELVPLPVSEVDRAIEFYEGRLGFTKDVDVRPADGIRVVQLTPEGSACSVGFGTGLEVYAGEPGGVRGVHLVVEDLDARRQRLRAAGDGLAPRGAVLGGQALDSRADNDSRASGRIQ
ncbi:VOC family protein [Pedococcus sp. NPDC057267]|uniref:VOC family protein n=1 Tax=Pedococcus sp. NPDC057267 TaxID=3346077 RepID=UPI003624C76D